MQFVWDFIEQLIPREATTVCDFHEEKRDLISRSRDRSVMASGPEVDASHSAEWMASEGEVISVPIEDAVYEVLKQSNFFSQIINQKFDCEAVLMDAPLNTPSSPLRAQKVYETKLGKRGKVLLSVWMDDLTRHKVDAVVNAANRNLEHGGGLALSIVIAGGEEIEKESKEIIRKEGKLNTGDVVHTSGGKLPCNFVIHAVGPECNHLPHDYGHEKCRDLLKKAIANIFEWVIHGKHCIKSVAIPALSSGIFRFPLKECAEIIVGSIKQFGEKDQFGENLKEIHLVNHDERTTNAMKKACEDIFESSGHGSSHANFEKPFSSNSPNSIVVNNVFLEIFKGPIEEQKTEVIVNSVDANRNLSNGQISKAILQKAGPGMQSEIRAQGPGSVIKTHGYNLNCQFVYHVILPEAKQPGADQEFQRVISECLSNARRLNLSSISFPAIGTGNLGFGKDRAANLLISAVLLFAQRYSGAGLHVCFVIYPTDEDTFTAFLRALQSQSSKIEVSNHGSNGSNGSVVENKWLGAPAEPIELLWAETGKNWKPERVGLQLGDFSSSPEKSDRKLMKPTIQVGGRDSSRVEEAVAWIEATIYPHEESLLIENNHIFYFGAKEHEALIQKLDSNVSLIENLKNGSAHIRITGSALHVINAALEIEKLLCTVQAKYESKQVEELIQFADPGAKKDNITCPKMCDLKKTIDGSTQNYRDKAKEFEKAGLLLVKMEQIQNPLLKIVYQLKKDAIEEKRKRNAIHTLYHQVPAQFCNLVCKIGFQRIYSHSHEQRYGAGIYFYKSVRILQANSKPNLTADKYTYIFQAEVATGAFTKGKESYIVPPPVGADRMDLFDSVTDDAPFPETFVIFNSSQAIPQYLYTCAKK